MASIPDPPPAGEAPSAGGSDGDYRVGGLLRSGWGGPIHEGQYLRTGRRVSIQVVRPELAARPGFTQRLAAIGRAMAAIRDPHLLAVYDMVDVGDSVRLIAEWSEAEPLEAVAPVGALAAPRAATIVDGVLAGLAGLHAAGMFHGHVDRRTVVVGPDGNAKLAELAVCAAAAAPGSGPDTDLREAARLGLELLPEGGRHQPMRQVLEAAVQAPSPLEARTVRQAFAAAATASLGPAWQRSTERAGGRSRRRLLVVTAAAILVAGLGVAGGLLLFGGGGSHAAPAGPLTLGTDATLTVAPGIGGCNTTFVFVGRGSLRGTGTLVYRWEQSDGQSSANTPLTITADEGSFQLTQAWRLQGAQTVDGAMTLHILQPTEVSLKRSFRYACS